MPTNQDLIIRAAHGDRRSLNLLITRHYGLIYGLLRRFVHCPENARDLTQETFLKFVRALDTWKSEKPLEHYLKTIAMNTLRSHLRRRVSEQKAVQAAQQPDRIDSQAFDSLLKREWGERLSPAIEALPADLREVVRLRHFENRSFQEIASQLDISINTATSRMRYALGQLRKLLGHEEANTK